MKEHALSSLEDIRTEIATHRLLVRAILTYLICSKDAPAAQVLAEICAMLEGVGPYAVIADELDPDLRKAAIKRLRHRMTKFADMLEKLPIARA